LDADALLAAAGLRVDVLFAAAGLRVRLADEREDLGCGMGPP
jgi:hypothetical protein